MQISLRITLDWEMEKGQMEKEGKNKSLHLDFLSHNTLDHTQGIYKILRLKFHRRPEICDKKFDWRERKMDK